MGYVPVAKEEGRSTRNVKLAPEVAFASIPIVEMGNTLFMILEETTTKIAEIAKVLGNVRNAEQQGCLRQNAYVAMARESPLVSIRQAKSITSV